MKLLQFPLSKFIICFIIGIFITNQFNFDKQALVLLLVLTITLTLSNHIYTLKKKTNTIFFGILICISAFLFGCTTYQIHNQSKSSNNYINYQKAYSSPLKIELTIREKLKSNGFYDRYIAIINSIDKKNYSGKILFKIKKETEIIPLQVGNIILVKQVLIPISKPKNPSQFDYSDYLKNKNIFAQVTVTNYEILKTAFFKKDIWYYSALIRSKIIKEFESKKIKKEELNVAIALLLGQRQDLNPELIKDYQSAGATHLLAVSGLHVGFLLLFLNFFLNNFPKSNRYNLLKLLIILSSLAFYAIITGLSPSILRASIMFSFIAIAAYLRRPTNTFYTLLVSAFFILLFDSNTLFDVGFQLSYGAVFFIVWMQPLFKKIYTPKNIILQKAWDIFSVSLAAQLGTLPLTLYYFHQFPGLFFITNLVVIPLITIIMFVGISAIIVAAIGILPQIIASTLSYLIVVLNQFIYWIASFKAFSFQDIPFSRLLAVAIFLLIISSISYIKKCNFKNLFTLLSVCLVVQIVIAYQNIHNTKSQELIIYNTPKQTILSIKKGQIVTFYSNTNISLQNESINDYIIKNKTKFQSKKLANFFYFKGQKILIIDSSKTYLKNAKPDLLILIQSPQINLERVVKEIKPKIIIADFSNYKTTVDLWSKTCKSKKIPFHSTYKMGYYRIN